MNYVYYNQNSYSKVPYPSSDYPNATVKSGGCGVCCSAMMIENLLKVKFSPELAAKYSMSHGARDAGGTNMFKMLNALSKTYGITFSVTSSISKLKNHLVNGGMAVANVGGRGGSWKGVFSVGGHYVLVAGYDNSSDEFLVLDPNLYGGKFNTGFRRSKVRLVGNCCYCSSSILDKDAGGRQPSYYLVNAPEPKTSNAKKPIIVTTDDEEEDKIMIYNKVDEVPDWGRPAIEAAIACGMKTGDKHGNLVLTELELKMFVSLHKNNLLRSNPIYDTLDEVPSYWRGDIKELIDIDVLGGTGSGLGLTNDVCRGIILGKKYIDTKIK